MILNSEQLPNINRAFGGGTSWLDYETASPRGATDVNNLSPRNLKPKERPVSSKSMSSLSTNPYLDSNDPNVAYVPSPLYHNPNSADDHHLSQRQVNEFYMAIFFKKVTNRVCEHTLETHGLSLHRLQT